MEMFVYFLPVLAFSLLSFTESSKINYHQQVDLLNTAPRFIFLYEKGNFSTHQKGSYNHPLTIVHGEPASREDFCYAVYIQFTDGKSSWSCGGSLVTPTAVLTAAHCARGAASALAVVGALDLSKYAEPGRQHVRVFRSGLKVHEKYNTDLYYNDIGLINLPRPVTLSKNVCTVTLPSCSPSEHIANSDYTVCGWGKTSDKTLTSRLMYVTVPGEDHTSCGGFYKRNANYPLAQSQMCTSGYEGRSTCSGDSGGPLVQDGTQRGIVSLGMNSCETNAPSVYTDLSAFMPWLCPLIGKT